MPQRRSFLRVSNISRSKEGKKVGESGKIRPTHEINDLLDDIFRPDEAEGFEVLEGEE